MSDKSLGYGEVISYGRDGVPGGTSDSSDIKVRFPVRLNFAWNKQQGIILKYQDWTNWYRYEFAEPTNSD